MLKWFALVPLALSASAAVLALTGWAPAFVALARAEAPVEPMPRERTNAASEPKPGYRLVKDWDFANVIRTRSALDREFFTRYVYENGALDHLNDEWSRYRDAENHVFTPEGLALVARRTGLLAPGKITSGMLRSRFTFRFGIVEIRMKAPRGRGMFPAFWLNPEDGRWPPEIDVVEIVNDRGASPDRTFHFLHGAGRSKDEPRVSRLGRDHSYRTGDLSLDFHVFAVEWTKTRVRHFVDGVLVADRAYRWVHNDGSDGGPAHVLVNLAVGGKWPGPPLDEADFPASLQISSIRVWQPD